MSSREIADLTGKEHKNVKRDVENMFVELKQDVLSFERIYTDSMNRKQNEYCLDRLHVECLLMGYSATLRMKVLKRLRELEARLANPAPVPALTTSAADTINAGVALLDGSRKLLHISDSSVLAGLRQLQRAAGLPDLLPGYTVDAPPDATGGSSEPTASLRQLLTEHGIKLSSQKAYARLAELGIVEQKTRTSTRGEKHYWCLTEAGMEYGKNLTSPGNPRQTQPHFYEARFTQLIEKIAH
ncbi:TPA: Rha family transcriptional regulator [Escherichia coli]|nr:Rha family transcriptional regulator [Escherichia coli]HAH8500933.1 Rha family transcriptional regulator [Escherichia coli]